METPGYKLERALVAKLEEERIRKNVDVYELGRMAYSDRKEGRKVFANLVKGYTSTAVRGKKRGLSIEDFYRICVALGLEPIKIFSAVASRLEEESLPSDPSSPKKVINGNHA